MQRTPLVSTIIDMMRVLQDLLPILLELLLEQVLLILSAQDVRIVQAQVVLLVLQVQVVLLILLSLLPTSHRARPLSLDHLNQLHEVQVTTQVVAWLVGHILCGLATKVATLCLFLRDSCPSLCLCL